MQTLFDFLRRYRREDGSELCETFIRAPKRRTEPGYYEVVTDPIDMLRIQQKLKMDEYGNMEELKEDFGKLLKNALSYYKKGSQEFKDAVELQDLFVKAAGTPEFSLVLLSKISVFHTGAGIINLSKNSHFDNLIFDKIHIFKASFFTFTFSKCHF